MKVTPVSSGLDTTQAATAKASAGDQAFAGELQKAYDAQDMTRLKKVCKDFEQLFLNNMWKQMRATVPKDTLTQEDPGREIFQNMMDDKLMENVADSGRVGLGDMLYKQLSKSLERQYKAVSQAEGVAADAGKEGK